MELFMAACLLVLAFCGIVGVVYLFDISDQLKILVSLFEEDDCQVDAPSGKPSGKRQQS